MYSLWCSIRATRNVSSSTACGVLKIWHIARSTQTINLRHTTYVHTNIKRVLPRTTPRDIDFSDVDVSLKILLVLVHRRTFRPSHVHLLGGATVSRPHHCQTQNHNAVPRCRTDDRAKCIRLCRSSASITMPFNLYNTTQSGSFSGYSRLQRWQFYPFGRSCCVEPPHLTQRVPLALVKPHLGVRTCECVSGDDQVCHTCDVPRHNHSQVCVRLASDQCIPRCLLWRCRSVPEMAAADVAIDV